jgi:hypothetical protein
VGAAALSVVAHVPVIVGVLAFLRLVAVVDLFGGPT